METILLERILAGLDDDNPLHSVILKDWLANQGVAALPWLEQAYLRGPMTRRDKIAQVLYEMNLPEAAELLDALANQPEWSVRIPALGQVCRYGDREAFAETLHALQAQDASVRAAAAHIVQLCHTGTKSNAFRTLFQKAYQDLYSQSIQDSDSAARHAAVLALAALDHDRAFADLARELDNSSPQTRIAAIEALALVKTQLGIHRVSQAIIGALQDKEVSVRLAAVHALRHHPDTLARQALDYTYHRDPNEHVRVAAAKALGKPPPRKIEWKLVLGRAALVLVVLLLILIAGRFLYPFDDPVPETISSPTDDSVYAPSEITPVLAKIKLDEFKDGAEGLGTLVPVEGQSFRIPCARDLLEMIFDKRNCDAIVFQATASGSTPPLQFLALRNRAQPRVIAINLTEPEANSPDGLFIDLAVLGSGQDGEAADILQAASLETLRHLSPAEWKTVSNEQYQLYTPFVTNTRQMDQVQEAKASNPIIRHLWERGSRVNPYLRFCAPLYQIGETQALGKYMPLVNLIFRNAFDKNRDWDGTLAHELVHANLDGLEDKNHILQKQASYLRQKHPRLFELTLPALYHFEDKQTPADSEAAYVEEGLAFLAGSLAAHKLQVIYVAGIDEPLWSDDVEYLAQLGLIPGWLNPTALDYWDTRITSPYYELVQKRSPP